VAGVETPGPRALPRPPGTLPEVNPLYWTALLWRIATHSTLEPHAHPTPRYRFDAPHGEYPALYTCAVDLGTFAETYVDRGRRLGPGEGQRYLLKLYPLMPLTLIDFHDARVLAAYDLDERISVGDDYATCQDWALAIYRHEPEVAGICYRARKAGATIANVFLFADRAMSRLEVVNAQRLAEIEETVLRAADRYRLTVFFAFEPSSS